MKRIAPLLVFVFGFLGLNDGILANGFLYSNGNYSAIVVPGIDPANTGAGGINDFGVIVVPQGFLDNNGTFSSIVAPSSFGGATYTGINNGGAIVGYCCGLVTDGFLDIGGVFTTFDFPGSSPGVNVITRPTDINNVGQIVGTAEGGISPRGFVYANGIFTTIQVPTVDPFTTTEANGINDAGQVVGEYTDSTGRHGYLDTNGVFQTIDFPGSSNTWLQGINDAGDIVGWYVGNTDHGFLYKNGVFTQLDVPFPMTGGTQTRGLNNQDEIVGFYGLSSPPLVTPEPGSLTLLVLGIAGVALILRKRMSKTAAN